MKDCISVIVPVYNVAAYLPQCLDSILSQDHEALEVILIDDGSTDGSGEICDRYAAADSRIRVIHRKNGGAAAAKNMGLAIATGEYLSFVDSDDYLEPGAYRFMMEALQETGADAGEFSFRDVYRNREEEQILYPERRIMTGREYLIRYTESWTGALLWNKLYKRRLFDGVVFEEGHKIDDEYFTYQGFFRANRVVCDGRMVYNYRRRASSVMLSPAASAQRSLDRIDALSKRREKVAEVCPELRTVFDTDYINSLIYMSQYPNNTPESIAMLKRKLRQYLLERGNTFPPKRFWRGVAELLCVPTQKLLDKYGKAEEPVDPEVYFP